VHKAVRAVEAWYAARGLPPLFKLVESACAPPGLADRLGALGYRPCTETLMMHGPATPAEVAGVRLADDLDDAFSAVFVAAGPDSGDTAERLGALARVPCPRAFARLDVAGVPGAIGACAVEGDWTGIFAMRTAPDHRRRGLARRVLAVGGVRRRRAASLAAGGGGQRAGAGPLSRGGVRGGIPVPLLGTNRWAACGRVSRGRREPMTTDSEACRQPAGVTRPVIDSSRCEGKADCLRVCPWSVFEVRRLTGQERAGLGLMTRLKVAAHGGRQGFVVRGEDCQACGLCVAACPEDAIRLQRP
jgi:NAD-dependent dihydropyrimidine dehydrogenase PreA subunit